jgi:hypothetical protein
MLETNQDGVRVVGPLHNVSPEMVDERADMIETETKDHKTICLPYPIRHSRKHKPNLNSLVMKNNFVRC